MTGEVTILEKALVPLRAQFGEALAGLDLTPERLMRSVLTAYEGSKRLQECPLADVINAAMTGAYCGLIVDGLTGQAAIIPFRDNRTGRTRAQFIPMYRGYCTMASYSRMSMYADIVRDGDHFDYSLGTKPNIDHRPAALPGDRPILFAWATANAYDRPPIVSVMPIDRIRAIRDRAPSSRGADSAWKTDFAGMARKSPIRDLARFLPMGHGRSVSVAAQIEELHEHYGKPVSYHPEVGIMIAGPSSEDVARPPDEFRIARTRSGEIVACTSIEEWRGRMMLAAEKLSPEGLRQFYERNRALISEIAARHAEDAGAVTAAIEKRLTKGDKQ